MDKILSDMSQSRTVFDDKSESFNDYRIFRILETLKEDMSRCQNVQIRELEKRLDSIASDNHNKDCEEKIAALQFQISELQHLKTEFSQLREQKNALKELVEIMNSAADELKKENRALKEEQQRMGATCNTLKNDILNLKNEMDAMKKNLANNGYPYNNNRMFPKNDAKGEQE